MATLGTATSEEHIKRLFRLVPSILFCFDGEPAARRPGAPWSRCCRTCRTASACASCSSRGDPDSLVRAEGEDAFRARITQQAQPLAEYFFQQLMLEADPATLEGKAHLATLAAPLLEKIPGNNLRLLMRQRLSEITGLSGENIGQLAHQPAAVVHGSRSERHLGRRRLFRASAYYENEPSHAPFDAAPGYGEAQPRKSWNKDKAWDGKKWDGKKWDKGGRGDFKAPQRTPVSVESTTLNALRTLLHHPQLALKVDDAGTLAREQDTYAQLLVSLLEALQKNRGRARCNSSRAGTHAPGRLLQALGEKEWLIVQENLKSSSSTPLLNSPRASVSASGRSVYAASCRRATVN